MMHWSMLALVGRDRAGIVARVAQELYAAGANLGEASMLRLGGNFAIMLMVNAPCPAAELEALLTPMARALELRLHVDAIEPGLHQPHVPDVRVTVAGADRAGIVAEVTQALAAAGFNILDLESAVAGSSEHPLYMMHIDGCAEHGIEALRAALVGIAPGIEVHIHPLDVLLG